MIEPIDKRVKITSGEHAGRYIGPNFGGGLVTNPEMQADMPRKIVGTKYSSYSQVKAATKYNATSGSTAQQELRLAGIESTLEPV
jgi:hypothetical protein